MKKVLLTSAVALAAFGAVQAVQQKTQQIAVSVHNLINIVNQMLNQIILMMLSAQIIQLLITVLVTDLQLVLNTSVTTVMQHMDLTVVSV